MVIPYTDNIPHETAQDHDNQYLATLAQVGVDGDLYGKSGGDPGDWSGLLKGCWGSAFVPERELSWTLICYAGYYGQMEGSETEKLERLESVVKTVATRDAGQGACGGSHAFFALAFFLRSEAAAKTSQEVRQMADRCLTARVLEVVPRLTETARRYQAGMLGLTPLEASKSIMQEFGHHLEWLSIYCADDTLLSNDLQLIVTALIHSLDRQRSLRWDDIGSIAHALHGLKLYCRAVEGVRLGRGGGIPTSRAG